MIALFACVKTDVKRDVTSVSVGKLFSISTGCRMGLNQNKGAASKTL